MTEQASGSTATAVRTSLERSARIALHRVARRLPGPPPALSRSRPLATPPPGSGLKVVMGDYGYPVIGWAANWMYASPLPWSDAVRDTYGPLAWSGMFTKRVINVGTADTVQQVLINREGHWSSEHGWSWIIGPFFHRGIMLLDDPDHHRDRRIMQQAFTRRRLEAYLARLAPVTASRIDAWGSGRLHAYPRLKQLTLDVATDVFLDERPDGGSGRPSGPTINRVNQAFIDCVRAGTGVIRTDVPLTRWHRGLQGRTLLEEYFRDKLPAHRRSDGDDLLTALCHAESEDGERFSDDDVVNHIIFLMMAAHDTSTITTSSILWFLAKHPEWQERVREESLAMGAAPDGDVLDMRAIGQLTSLDLVMKEALRMVPPVFAMGRMAVQDTELDGYFVPAGTPASVSSLPVHYDPELWTDPHTFDPERFAEGRREDKRHPYGYFPFGGGAHKCIGMHFGQMEVKTIVHQLLRRHRITAPAADLTSVATSWDWTSLPKPLDDLPIVLEPIS